MGLLNLIVYNFLRRNTLRLYPALTGFRCTQLEYFILYETQ